MSEQPSSEQIITAIVERGKVVWVVFGVYHDRSASTILGIYTDQWTADDRVQMARAAGSMYSVNYAKVPLDKTFPVDLKP